MTPREQSWADAITAWRALTPGQRDAAIDAQWAARAADDLGVRLAMDAELCPSGTGPCGCGDGPPRLCGKPDRPLEVRASDCLACKAREWWEAGRASRPDAIPVP